MSVTNKVNKGNQLAGSYFDSCTRAPKQFTLALLLVTLLQVRDAWSHGRLMDPPSRNSLWRFGYQSPINYNDNELFCGGHEVQWGTNGGKCGVCGDAWNLPQPRPHEDGGHFGNGIIARHYTAGQDINVEVDLTANHMGTFWFKLCGHNGNRELLTQECFDKYPLMLVNPNGSLSESFTVLRDPSHAKGKLFQLTVRLPPYLTCTRCVIQWTYRSGNGWGICPDGVGALGCGPQETFVNCADVSITTNTGSGFGPVGNSIFVNDHPSTQNRWKNQYKNSPLMTFSKDFTKKGSSWTPYAVRSQVCVALGADQFNSEKNKWCQMNCVSHGYETVNCPKDKCKCLTDCDALPPFSKMDGSRQYCEEKCLVYPFKCPRDKCNCR